MSTCNCPTNTGGTVMHNATCVYKRTPEPGMSVVAPMLMMVLRFTATDEIAVGNYLFPPITDDEIEQAIQRSVRVFLEAVRKDGRVQTL